MRTAAARCPRCDDTGWTIETHDGLEVATRCACRRQRDPGALLKASRIPGRYHHCTIENFEVWAADPEDRRRQMAARRATREFVDSYPGVDKGLLFVGSVGTGKTHLAVAALRELVETKGVRGVYLNALDLVQQLQMSFDGGGASREEILAPITEAELLVLDELGAGRLTDWVRDLLYYVINSRYMAQRITIFTSNFLDAAATPAERSGVERRSSLDAVVASGQLKATPFEESLADRISARLRSRLFEMCDLVELRGQDYRARHQARPNAR